MFIPETKPLESTSDAPGCSTGRSNDGFILQKYVEKPHLLDAWKLLKASRPPSRRKDITVYFRDWYCKGPK